MLQTYLSLFGPPLVLAVGLVAGACVLATRVGWVVPSVFIALYILVVGALTFINIGVFHMVDSKFREYRIDAWIQIYWPLWSTFFAPSALLGLVACWYSRPTTKKVAAKMLGAYLCLILIAVEVGWVLDPYTGRYGMLFLLGELVVLTAIFFSVAHVRRRTASPPSRGQQ